MLHNEGLRLPLAWSPVHSAQLLLTSSLFVSRPVSVGPWSQDIRESPSLRPLSPPGSSCFAYRGKFLTPAAFLQSSRSVPPRGPAPVVRQATDRASCTRFLMVIFQTGPNGVYSDLHLCLAGPHCGLHFFLSPFSRGLHVLLTGLHLFPAGFNLSLARVNFS
jgi:hypothetical protein